MIVLLLWNQREPMGAKADLCVRVRCLLCSHSLATVLPKIINKMKYGFRLDGDRDIFEGICRYVLISTNKEDEVI